MVWTGCPECSGVVPRPSCSPKHGTAPTGCPHSGRRSVRPDLVNPPTGQVVCGTGAGPERRVDGARPEDLERIHILRPVADAQHREQRGRVEVERQARARSPIRTAAAGVPVAAAPDSRLPRPGDDDVNDRTRSRVAHADTSAIAPVRPRSRLRGSRSRPPPRRCRRSLRKRPRRWRSPG